MAQTPDGADGVRDFVRAAWPRLLRTARLLTGDPHEAEDLTQATLVRVVGAWSRIERRDDPVVYARRVMVNLASSRWRRGRHYRDVVARHEPSPPGGDDPAVAIADRDAVVRLLADLPPRTRAVLVLRYFEDLSEAETARVLGCSVGSVKSQASRGLARMRVAVEKPPAVPSRRTS